MRYTIIPSGAADMSKPPTLERSAQATADAFLTLAAIIATLPGAPLRSKIDRTWRAVQSKRAINRDWDKLSTTGVGFGRPTADSVLVEFMDFGCVFCRLFADSLPVFFERHPDVRIAVHLVSRKGADLREIQAAAICAAAQGALPLVNRTLFALANASERYDWGRLADSLGVPDPDAFVHCRRSAWARDQLRADSALAEDAKISVTPSFLTPSRGIHEGISSIDEIAGLAVAHKQ